MRVEQNKRHHRADKTSVLRLVQGFPGQTLPGAAGDQGLPGEKVSVSKPFSVVVLLSSLQLLFSIYLSIFSLITDI